MKVRSNEKRPGGMKNDIDCIKLIVEHYSNHGRHDLIWRKKINPYRVLVSEVMLQQTQVVRVMPKFSDWMKLYPTLSKLRKARLKDLLILWQGLGYQRRAKALYSISQTITSLPKTFDELIKLPCIGPYTASAIMAFAYNTFSHPVLETNIRTALIEMYYKNLSSVDDRVLYSKLSELAKYQEIQSLGARHWYYALMDYGAHLKVSKVSHNKKSNRYIKQKPYKGSLRQLRAQVLFAVTRTDVLPDDERIDAVLKQLLDEGFIKVYKKSSNGYAIK
jgi:A/G-specific adenine glycosylase